MSITSQKPKNKSTVAIQYLKGEVHHEDFTAKVFSIELINGKWRMFGSKIDAGGTTYKIQLDIPETYKKGVYKLQDHPGIAITYSTTHLEDPLLKYVGQGLLDLIEVDADNRHVSGGLAGGITKEDGDGRVFTVDFLFSFG
ncbi:hypothetical protein SAMN04490186_4553 [Pseudomonas grimontii]|uniref:Uncharacterized protein n=1 Tax=Pseudomonas grimontii TaxID=129847 RepID=A0A1H1HNL4_9PSED|nr:hypothetical protein [Pseudomonas grimontii]TWR59579.1 hypothetical protein FIV39_27830 [Pseudomonas grimontii]SDR26738.1 hypothetical protein SAMN04490186_4553 [Pseudomonas grimontii]